ncbi:MAG: hypothetical protein AB8F74_10420 [Saprospiraceae bacterium]
MIPKKNISTIEEIEEAQAKLRLTMAVTKQEFERSLANSKIETKDFLLKKVAIPVGAVGLGVAATKKMINSLESEKEDHNKTTIEQKSNFLNSIIPLGLSILQAFILKKQKEEIKENHQSEKVEDSSLEEKLLKTTKVVDNEPEVSF